jgi:glycerophosphoryl diester phosphodiesterase
VTARPLISAHRGGRESARPGGYEAYQAALAAGVDYLEFDVRGLSDGTLVAYHHADVRPGHSLLGRRLAVADLGYPELCELTGQRVPVTADLLGLISAGHARAHIDLKESAHAEGIVEQALAVLDPAAMVVTTRDVTAAAQLARRYPAVPVGITVGGDLAESARCLRERVRASGLSRLTAVTAAGASWAVLHRRLARPSVLTECRELGLTVMVWTVNFEPELRRTLGLSDVDVVVTDRPGRAIQLRGGS